ncbi:MAG: enoyl-CoA hydratase [Actinobacteria bacterium]|nr:enoyl-CoA hydratase [Actinomycetota bacterium]
MPMVIYDVRDGIATLTLNNPSERNSMTAEMVRDIVASMDAAEADPDVGVVIVTGTPPAFCAGANLGNLAEATRESLLDIYEGFLRIARSPLPTIAAVNGAAVGAGMNLALGCDLRIAAESAKFDTRFLQLGLHPGGGNTWMQLRIAGLQATMATALFGEVLDGDAAVAAGLAWKCVPDDELLPTARAADAQTVVVARNDANLESVQPQFFECESRDDCHRFGHITLSGFCLVDPITDGR